MSRSLLGPLVLAALAAEIGLVAYVVIAARRAVAQLPENETDATTRFRFAARQVLRSRPLADVLTTEVMLLYCAFRWPQQARKQDGTFTVHRTSTYVSILVGIAMALAMETLAVHFLVRTRSVALAWVLTALSIYTLLWLIGDYRALVARPIRVTAAHLRFRFGLRWEGDVPREAIGEVELLAPATGCTAKEKGRLVASLPGGANVKIGFTRPLEFLGLYGMRRQVSDLRVRVDEPEKLRLALERT